MLNINDTKTAVVAKGFRESVSNSSRSSLKDPGLNLAWGQLYGRFFQEFENSKIERIKILQEIILSPKIRKLKN